MVRRADAGEGRAEPVLLDGSETDGAGSRKGARAGSKGRDRKRNELHLPVRRRPRPLPQLLQGAIVTFELGLLTFWGGALIGLLGASLKTFGGPWLRGLANAYVIFFTNTPALIQIYFLYFGLPEVGIRWDNFTCVLIGLTLNAGAYLTEIMRAGFISVHRTEMEAAETLGMSLCSRSASSSCRISPRRSIRPWPISSSSCW